VMSRVAGNHAKIAGVLHDVIEDTPVSAGDLLAAGCPPQVVATRADIADSGDDERSVPSYLPTSLLDGLALLG
jgi:hypothetical protein